MSSFIRESQSLPCLMAICNRLRKGWFTCIRKRSYRSILNRIRKTYALREKATLKIKVTDGNGVPVKTNLGLSVFDKAYINPADPVNILTHCYLSSQIRGKIHNPLYYFDEKNKDRMQAMDLLLLTQGWRRYVWNIEYAPR